MFRIQTPKEHDKKKLIERTCAEGETKGMTNYTYSIWLWVFEYIYIYICIHQTYYSQLTKETKEKKFVLLLRASC